jgi:hypothetical protein
MGYASDREGHPDDFVPLHERLAAYQRRDDLKAAGDEVVELKPPSDQWARPSGSEPISPPMS